MKLNIHQISEQETIFLFFELKRIGQVYEIRKLFAEQGLTYINPMY